jgi:hypothetical protein
MTFFYVDLSKHSKNNSVESTFLRRFFFEEIIQFDAGKTEISAIMCCRVLVMAAEFW